MSYPPSKAQAPNQAPGPGSVQMRIGIRRTRSIFRRAMPAGMRLRRLAALVLLMAGCSGIPQPRVEPPPAAPAAPPMPSDPDAAMDAGRGEFAIAASMLDTWNAAGQILVRLDGVTYEGRAQMLGIYVVRYRGERFLILTRALVMRSQAQGMLTKVGSVLMDGKPNDSDAAVELLDFLQARLPAELALIKAGGR